MKRIKLIIAALLTLALTVGIFAAFGGEKAQAATKPAKAKVTVKANDDDKSATLTIAKTKNAQGYKIMVKKPGAKKFTALTTLKEDGTAKRTYTAEKLTEGEYQFKVRAYLKTGKKTVWGKYCKVAKVKIAAKDSGKDDKDTAENSDFSKAKTGDIISFGSYEQDNNTKNGKEKIEWIVLSNNGKELFVISKYVLDYQTYADSAENSIWEKSTLRSWLNKDFYDAAFSDSEKAKIKLTKLSNHDNPEFGIDGGNDTEDKVFLLSLEETINTEFGFGGAYYYGEDTEDINRRCAPTKYAAACGIFVNQDSEYKTKDGEATCGWILRSPGKWFGFTGYVRIHGGSDTWGVQGEGKWEVRPAIVINIK